MQILSRSNLGLCIDMDVYQARLDNLLTLLAREGEVQRLADKIGTPPAYISQITSHKTKRHMGAVLARKIERAYNLPRGWMDMPHGQDNAEALVLAKKIACLSPACRAALRTLIDSMLDATSTCNDS